ncbi:MAG: PEP-CTERM sorting domain-containing protein, partial [Phycisphaerales bacterium]|nr:PEP-CTERM sorting domain-containing protein [Phycisphaerales bacterium]
IAPGVTASADSDSITLSGSVSRFLIGGQELAIDNIIAVPEPTCLALLGIGGLVLLRRVRRSRP